MILGTIYTFYVFIFTSNLNQMKILEQICQEINLVLYSFLAVLQPFLADPAGQIDRMHFFLLFFLPVLCIGLLFETVYL